MLAVDREGSKRDQLGAGMQIESMLVTSHSLTLSLLEFLSSENLSQS